MTNFANSDGVQQLISELRQAFRERNDLRQSPVYSSDRQGLIRSIARYTAHDVPVLLLDDLAWRLVSTVGTQQTLRHFLPRIFEEALTGDGLDRTTWWMIANKLQMATFERWTPEQRQLTLAAIKLWMAKDEIDIAGLALDSEALLRMPMEDVVALYDPYYGIAERWWERAGHHVDEITFLIEEAAALSAQ